MDFERILNEWEKRGQSSNTPDKDETPPVRVTRSEMERARAEAELDLHGMTREGAIEALRAFLAEAAAEGRRKVRIIHGKGLHSENSRGVLAEAVRETLARSRNVAAWGEAGRKEGGRGASWAWLSVRGK